jgi:hypothetical protein
MRTIKAGIEIRVYTENRKSWHFVAPDGMEVVVVNGKRRRDAMVAHLTAQTFAGWYPARVAACEWIAANPRKVAVAA